MTNKPPITHAIIPSNWTLASPAASHIWSETELSKQRWVVWDISRELQAGQDCATQTFLQSKAGLEVYKVIVLDTDCVNVQYTQLMSDTC